MTQNIKSSTKSMLTSSNLFNSSSLSKILNKLEKTKIHIGSLNVSSHIDLLDERYSTLKFESKDSLRKMNTKLRLFNEQNRLDFILRPEEFSASETYQSWTQNSYNIYKENLVYIIAGMLFSPHFDSNFPMSFNYGAIGTIIGHELWHSFDPKGILHDENGYKNDWLSNESLKSFKNKTQCLLDQYKEKTMQQVNEKVDAVKTLEENFSDNVGLKSAYFAYKNHQSNNKEKKTISGYEKYSNDQQFFIAFASQWCFKASNTAYYKYFLVNEHAPPNIRVNTALSNFPQFSHTFKCPSDSKMNLLNRCEVF